VGASRQAEREKRPRRSQKEGEESNRDKQGEELTNKKKNFPWTLEERVIMRSTLDEQLGARKRG